MKIKTIKCPNCNAKLSIQPTRSILYCEYCGTEIFLDDEVKRTEITQNINIIHHKVDEAQLRKIKLKEKEYNRKVRTEIFKNKGKRILVGILVAFLALQAARRKVDNYFEERYSAKITAQVEKICEEQSASIDWIHVDSDSISIQVESDNDVSEDIDSLQEAILESISIKKGYTVHLYIDYPKDNTIRDISVNAYGKKETKKDLTNNISSEEKNQIIRDYSSAFKNIGLEACKTNYEGNELTVQIQTSTFERIKLDQITDTIKEANCDLNSLPLRITYMEDMEVKDKEKTIILQCAIDTEGSITVLEDNSNEMSDNDVEKLKKQYLEKTNDVGEKYDAKVSDISVKKDIMFIEISTNHNERSVLLDFEKALYKGYKKLKKIPLHFYIKEEDSYSITKEWTVDELGVENIIEDRTRANK